MIDKEQAREFIDATLSKLEKSVVEGNTKLIRNNGYEFKNLISDYGRIIGKESTANYLKKYESLMIRGGCLK